MPSVDKDRMCLMEANSVRAFHSPGVALPIFSLSNICQCGSGFIEMT